MRYFIHSADMFTIEHGENRNDAIKKAINKHDGHLGLIILSKSEDDDEEYYSNTESILKELNYWVE